MEKIRTLQDIDLAIRAGDLGKVKALMGNDVELRDGKALVHGTWLHLAAKLGRLPIVEWLVEAGADINRRGGIRGGNALDLAASEGHFDVVRYLLNRGAEMDVCEPQRNPLFSAISADNLEIVKLLLRHGIDPNVNYFNPKNEVHTAYTFAREMGCTKIADYLQKHTINDI